jgi:hypothetical protein
MSHPDNTFIFLPCLPHQPPPPVGSVACVAASILNSLLRHPRRLPHLWLDGVNATSLSYRATVLTPNLVRSPPSTTDGGYSVRWSNGILGGGRVGLLSIRQHASIKAEGRFRVQTLPFLRRTQTIASSQWVFTEHSKPHLPP